MAGLNHEFFCELLWREFPGDLRHTAFRRVLGRAGWRSRRFISGIRGARRQLRRRRRAARALIRGELLRRHPGRGDLRDPGARRPTRSIPRRSCRCSAVGSIRTSPSSASPTPRTPPPQRWFFVIPEQPSAPRFGLDKRGSRAVAGGMTCVERYAYSAGPMLRAATSSPARARPARLGASTPPTWRRSCASCRCVSPSTPTGYCRPS